MVVGTCIVELQIPENSSLKGKRQVLRSIKDRIRARFNVSIAEVDRQDSWQRATLGVAAVSNDAQLVDETLNKVINCIEGSRDALLLDYSIDLVTHR
ncbi:MAG: DUF503 domain-containing protein [candidate division NC10 bacterium]|nr:DUF503 domain-containing protein [candidate division NC10 bacterium]